MPDKRELKDSDRFSLYMRQRLENHRTAVDDDCWKEIEARRQKTLRRSRHTTVIRLAAFITAAAACVALMWMLPGLRDVRPTYQPEQSALQQERPIAPAETTSPTLTASLNTAKASLNTAKAVKDAPLPPVESETPCLETPQPEDATVDTATEQEPEDDPPKAFMPPRSGEYNVNRAAAKLPSGNKAGRGAKGGTWLVSAFFSSSGSFSMTEGNVPMSGDKQADYLADAPPLSASYEKPVVIVPKEYEYLVPGYASHSCLPPLSLSVLVRRELGGYLAVESGLTYTYLSTKFKGAAPVNEAHLELHYLGIPVNIIGYLHQGAKWDVYSSAGIIVEKGVRSVYKQHQYSEERIVSHDIKTNIEGLQWSLGGSFGLSYHLHTDWSVYFEPRVSYYFDSGQPISMRTENPFTVSLGAGIRYGF
jgi:hypothetical protein